MVTRREQTAKSAYLPSNSNGPRASGASLTHYDGKLERA